MKNIAVLEVNLDAIKSNISVIKLKLNKNQKMCLVSKANAYGLGDKKVCKYLNNEVDYFAVSSVDEFLRVLKITNKKIFLLDPIYENITKVANKKGVLCVSNLESFDKILKAAKRNKRIKFEIQIAINTGMNRFGFSDEKTILSLIEKVKKVQNIYIFSVFSHYFQANNENIAKKQYNKFLKFKKIFVNNYQKNEILFHISNSVATENFNREDIARIGIFAYDDKRFQTIKLTAKIIDFQFLKKGESAGYDKQFVACRDTKLAIVSIGYADGIFRNIVKKGYVLINDCYCKIVAICMDSILVDVTNVECKVCDEVVLIGKDKKNQIFICDLANWCDTISYEILTHISKRVKRIYKKG